MEPLRLTIPQKTLLEADERQRDLERRARLGDVEAGERLKRELLRSGVDLQKYDYDRIRSIMVTAAGTNVRQLRWVNGELPWGSYNHPDAAGRRGPILLSGDRASRENLVNKINSQLRMIDSRAVLYRAWAGTPKRFRLILAVWLPSVGVWADGNSGAILETPPEVV